MGSEPTHNHAPGGHYCPDHVAWLTKIVESTARMTEAARNIEHQNEVLFAKIEEIAKAQKGDPSDPTRPGIAARVTTLERWVATEIDKACWYRRLVIGALVVNAVGWAANVAWK